MDDSFDLSAPEARITPRLVDDPHPHPELGQPKPKHQAGGPGPDDQDKGVGHRSLLWQGASETIGPLPQIAPKKLWVPELWQGGMRRRGRPMWQWSVLPAG